MYVEQRLYTAHPGRLPAWLAAYGELGSAASNRHMGPLLGAFTVEVGPINSVVLLRGFDDIDDRERGLTARETDPDWARFREEAGRLGALAKQETQLIKTAPFSPQQSARAPFARTTTEGLVVDHRTYDFHPGKMDLWIKAYTDLGLPVQQRLLGQLFFFGMVECGPINRVVFMWLYTSLGDRDRRRTAMMSDPGWADFRRETGPIAPLKQQTIMILKPTAFSPLR